MNDEAILEELVGLLENHGVKVRREVIDDSTGGLCRIGGKPVMFLNTITDPIKSAEACAKALCEVADIDSIYLRPNIRQFIESIKERG